MRRHRPATSDCTATRRTAAGVTTDRRCHGAKSAHAGRVVRVTRRSAEKDRDALARDGATEN